MRRGFALRGLDWPLALTCLAMAGALTGCATYREDLNRGQRLYEENQYEHALAIWRSLEPDVDSLSFNDQARYAYLRGITDFRLGFRPDARHWLAVARATEQEHPGGLHQEWKERIDKSLEELNRDVYGTNKGFADAAAPANGAAGAAATPATSVPSDAGSVPRDLTLPPP